MKNVKEGKQAPPYYSGVPFLLLLHLSNVPQNLFAYASNQPKEEEGNKLR